MQIKVVTSNSFSEFEKEVNALLSEGWELHGDPKIETTAHQDTWMGRLRSWSESHYSQVLKRN